MTASGVAAGRASGAEALTDRGRATARDPRALAAAASWLAAAPPRSPNDAVSS